MQLLWYARSQAGYVYTMGDCDVIFQRLTRARTPRSALVFKSCTVAPTVARSLRQRNLLRGVSHGATNFHAHFHAGNFHAPLFTAILHNTLIVSVSKDHGVQVCFVCLFELVGWREL